MYNYKIAPFFVKRMDKDVLLTNDAGRYVFVPNEKYLQLVSRQLPKDDILYETLKELGFIFDTSLESYLRTWAPEVRISKKCHMVATQLFILVLTSSCNQCCIYCQASAGNKNEHMSKEVAFRAIDLAFSSPANDITIEFQGGEPTLNESVLRDSILYARKKEQMSEKSLSLTIVTNLTYEKPELISWLIKQDVGICTSLDGPKDLHDNNRPMRNGDSSYDTLQRGIENYRSFFLQHGNSPAIRAIQTTTKQSLNRAEDIVEEYRRLGCDSIYMRPLTPLGFASSNWDLIGYTAQDFLEYYRRTVDYLLNLERKGMQFRDITTGIFLHRILLHEAVYHTEHRSPCGGAIGQMAIQYNGNVYTCDEGRMLGTIGDDAFKIGCVTDSYANLISSPVVHALSTSSCIEGLPECCDCAYQPFCSTCPIVTYHLENDIVSRQYKSYRCATNMGMLDHIFYIIKAADEKDIEILFRWAQ